MASTKISQLPATTAITQTDIAAVVDNGFTTTSKITKENLFRAKNGSVSSSAVSNGSSDLLGTDASEIRNNSYTSAIVGAYGSYIDDGQNHFIGGASSCSIQSGAAGHGGIVGCDGVSITGGYNNFIGGSYSGPSIVGGEENVILSSVGGTSVGGQNNAAISTQGVQLYGNKVVVMASEAISSPSNNTRMAAVMASYGGNIYGDYYNFRLGSYDASVNNGYGANENVGDIGGRGNTLIHNRSTMISASGRTTQYSGTAHFDNTYVFGHKTHPNTITTTISNQQTFNADNGMIQYCDVSAGNLNLIFDNIRNGESYDWVIENNTGGNISVNSVSVPSGFTSSHNISGGGVDTGANMFRIVVINDLVVIRLV